MLIVWLLYLVHAGVLNSLSVFFFESLNEFCVKDLISGLGGGGRGMNMRVLPDGSIGLPQVYPGKGVRLLCVVCVGRWRGVSEH